MLSPHDARGMMRAANRRFRRAVKAADERAEGKFYFGPRLIFCRYLDADRQRLHQLANECQRRAVQLYRVEHPVHFFVDEAVAFDAANASAAGFKAKYSD